MGRSSGQVAAEGDPIYVTCGVVHVDGLSTDKHHYPFITWACTFEDNVIPTIRNGTAIWVCDSCGTEHNVTKEWFS